MGGNTQVLLSLFLLLLADGDWLASPAPSLQPLFATRTSPSRKQRTGAGSLWMGADVGTSLVTPDGKQVLWLFGDTLIGAFDEGKTQVSLGG